MWERYVRRVEAACGDGRDFLVTFHPQAREAALRHLQAKCQFVPTRSRVVVTGRYQEKNMSLFSTGTLLIRECQGQEDAIQFLEMLFRDGDKAHGGGAENACP